MTHADLLLAPTRLLDFESTTIAALLHALGWKALPPYERIGAIYDFVRNEIAFGYSRADDIPASQVLADSFGQCNTKGTLLMALLRGGRHPVQIAWLHRSQGAPARCRPRACLSGRARGNLRFLDRGGSRRHVDRP